MELIPAPQKTVLTSSGIYAYPPHSSGAAPSTTRLTPYPAVLAQLHSFVAIEH